MATPNSTFNWTTATIAKSRMMDWSSTADRDTHMKAILNSLTGYSKHEALQCMPTRGQTLQVMCIGRICEH